MLDQETCTIFTWRTIHISVVDKDCDIHVGTITGQVVYVSLAVAAEGTFSVHGVVATSDGEVVDSKIEYVMICK